MRSGYGNSSEWRTLVRAASNCYTSKGVLKSRLDDLNRIVRHEDMNIVYDDFNDLFPNNDDLLVAWDDLVDEKVIECLAVLEKNHADVDYTWNVLKGLSHSNELAMQVLEGDVDAYGELLVVSEKNLPNIDQAWLGTFRCYLDSAYYGCDLDAIDSDALSSEHAKLASQGLLMLEREYYKRVGRDPKRDIWFCYYLGYICQDPDHCINNPDKSKEWMDRARQLESEQWNEDQDAVAKKLSTASTWGVSILDFDSHAFSVALCFVGATATFGCYSHLPDAIPPLWVMVGSCCLAALVALSRLFKRDGLGLLCAIGWMAYAWFGLGHAVAHGFWHGAYLLLPVVVYNLLKDELDDDFETSKGIHSLTLVVMVILFFVL